MTSTTESNETESNEQPTPQVSGQNPSWFTEETTNWFNQAVAKYGLTEAPKQGDPVVSIRTRPQAQPEQPDGQPPQG